MIDNARPSRIIADLEKMRAITRIETQDGALTKGILAQHDDSEKKSFEPTLLKEQERDEHGRWVGSGGVAAANHAAFAIGAGRSSIQGKTDSLNPGTKDYSNVKDLLHAEFRLGQGLKASRGLDAAGAAEHYTATRDIVQGVLDRGSSSGADLSHLNDAHDRLTNLIDVHAAQAQKHLEVEIAKLEYEMTMGGHVSENARAILEKIRAKTTAHQIVIPHEMRARKHTFFAEKDAVETDASPASE